MGKDGAVVKMTGLAKLRSVSSTLGLARMAAASYGISRE
jgi:hypothetical protein